MRRTHLLLSLRLLPLLPLLPLLAACQPQPAEPAPLPPAPAPRPVEPAPAPAPAPELPPPAPIVAWPELVLTRSTGGGEADAALVMGVEDYAFAPDVPGARQNATDWYAYLTRTLRIPPARVTLLLDTEVYAGAMRARAKEAAAAVRPGGTLWLVFVGHGAPARDGSDGVLVGADAQQTVENLYDRSVRQQELLELLGRGAQARTVAVIDACFSGKSGSGGMLLEGLQPMLPVQRATRPPPRRPLVLLTAGAGDQFAGPLAGASRPAFSYLVLGALRGWGDQDHDGRVTAEEVVTYARESLQVTVKGRRQTPELAAGSAAEVLAKGGDEAGPDLVAMVLASARAKPPSADTSLPSARSGPPPSIPERPPPQLATHACPEGMAPVPAGSAVAAFCLDRAEVTVAAFADCVKRGACKAAQMTASAPGSTLAQRREMERACNGAREDRAEHPVNSVDWDAAAGYCALAGKRLPTESEWEWAASGGPAGTT